MRAVIKHTSVSYRRIRKKVSSCWTSGQAQVPSERSPCGRVAGASVGSEDVLEWQVAKGHEQGLSYSRKDEDVSTSGCF